MELVAMTIIVVCIMSLIFIGIGYLIGTITIEDAKTDIPNDALAEKIRTIMQTGVCLSRDEVLYLEEAAQRLENQKEEQDEQDIIRG